MNRKEIYALIDQERNYQDEKWGGPDHDLNHTIGDWLLFIEKFLNRAKQNYIKGDGTQTGKNVIQIASLCVALLECKSKIATNMDGRRHGKSERANSFHKK
jgi:hypothetical protein